jgi:hypothetical protein
MFLFISTSLISRMCTTDNNTCKQHFDIRGGLTSLADHLHAPYNTPSTTKVLSLASISNNLVKKKSNHPSSFHESSIKLSEKEDVFLKTWVSLEEREEQVYKKYIQGPLLGEVKRKKESPGEDSNTGINAVSREERMESKSIKNRQMDE